MLSFDERTYRASVQRLRMQIFHQAVIVAIVDRHADDHRAWHRERFLKCRRDLLWPFDLQSSGAKSLGKPDDINWPQGDTGQPPVLCRFLNANHVIETINPHQMDEVGFQTDGC